MAAVTSAPRTPAVVRRPAVVPAPSAGGPERDTRVKRTLYVVGGTLAALVFLVPLLVAFLRAGQPGDVIVAAPDGRFLDLSWVNFRAVIDQPEVWRGILNSVIVSVSTAVLTAALATLAGYGFARFPFRARGVLFGLVLVTLMIPFQAILTPLYLQMNVMGLTDSLFGLVLFYTTVNLPFGIFVMRNTFAAVPAELEDSAHVDGAGTLRILVSVLRPLVVPGTATAALYAFLASWTEFLGALTFLTDSDLYTLPVSLVNLQQGAYGQVNFGLLAAGSVIAMIPCVILYVALQRYYVAGLASGSVKG
ncbi:carbohydrate ABC transporter permease [Promicromonospora thailandica]|uniref:Multiple sugar transport system permease protein n=1 Tax=Promicromonospora thailandica TaxID=765201 RepID=A0A9X2JW37_9MICO|nr:carbohydrate ABC transporter permease [Promicromonospora thailandica]MCP2262714.1 multiple sugar transport system permease protein [Promicromonospora thailandica]BFF18037.1 carbohydrate ABC transporter permease [Promicromonospora thailandica]